MTTAVRALYNTGGIGAKPAGATVLDVECPGMDRRHLRSDSGGLKKYQRVVQVHR